MTEHQNLRIFRCLGRASNAIQPKTDKDQVQQAYGHHPHPAGCRRPVPAKPQIKSSDTITGTHTFAEPQESHGMTGRVVGDAVR